MTLAELLATHPWPHALADQRRLEWRWSIDVGATPEQLWPLLSDVSRVNRALGSPVMTFVETDGVRHGSARYTGIQHEWIEVPWNWVAGRWYELLRLYDKGAMRALRSVCVLERTDIGTRVHLYFGVVPRSRIFDVALNLRFASLGRAYRRLLPQIARELGTAAPPCLEAPPPELTNEGIARIEQLRGSLARAEVPAALVQTLTEWIAHASDAELARIRVRERARAWNVDEDLLLRLCLHATRAGLLELSWDVICPHCRGVRETTGALAALPSSGTCEPCGITFGTDHNEAIEITFHVHPSIRAVVAGVYCSAEPAHKAHIYMQRAVPAGGRAEVPAPTTPGRYRLRIQGEMRGAWLDVTQGAAPAVEWTAGQAPPDAQVAPDGTLALVNGTDGAVTFVIETAEWLDVALRPGRVLSMQAFRDLFASDYLASGVKLAVGDQTVLFTDLVGSTAMYAERGDPAAFVDVKLHFERVFAIIAEHHGAVVKTIGDAVMGAFNDPVDALKAARRIHAAFGPGERLKLRISVNSGTCIAVRLNAAIDYFGHAVNLAAKLQGLAEAWQVALSSHVADEPRVAAYLAEQGGTVERVPLTLKGLEPIEAVRWTVA